MSVTNFIAIHSEISLNCQPHVGALGHHKIHYDHPRTMNVCGNLSSKSGETLLEDN